MRNSGVWKSWLKKLELWGKGCEPGNKLLWMVACMLDFSIREGGC